MARYEFSPEAVEDLSELFDYMESQSPDAADKLEQTFRSAFEHLADWPEAGHSRADLTELPVRFWPVGAYLVVYRALANRIQIVAVLHGARDVVAVLSERALVI